MANGMSTLFIAQGVKDNGGGTHTCIDPFQSTQWANTARNSVQRAGMQDMVRVGRGSTFTHVRHTVVS